MIYLQCAWWLVGLSVCIKLTLWTCQSIGAWLRFCERPVLDNFWFTAVLMFATIDCIGFLIKDWPL